MSGRAVSMGRVVTQPPYHTTGSPGASTWRPSVAWSGAGGRFYRVAPRSEAARRRETRFVARYDELELLRSRLTSAVRGHGQVVGLMGEAGIGKSRLLGEFRRSCARRP
jgi:predicted ATP-dependent serine protease